MRLWTQECDPRATYRARDPSQVWWAKALDQSPALVAEDGWISYEMLDYWQGAFWRVPGQEVNLPSAHSTLERAKQALR